MRQSNEDFVRVVWPAIGDRIGGGTIVPVETVVEHQFAKDLDILAGVDVWQKLDGDLGMRGIASRVQWGHSVYRTFTIRRSLPSGHDTEYQKRRYAIDGKRGLLYPHVTIQAYLDSKGGDLMAVAACRTSDLIDLCDEGRVRQNGNDGKTFYYVNWADFEMKGRPIRIVDYASDLS
jgi:hypothetical protein